MNKRDDDPDRVVDRVERLLVLERFHHPYVSVMDVRAAIQGGVAWDEVVARFARDRGDRP